MSIEATNLFNSKCNCDTINSDKLYEIQKEIFNETNEVFDFYKYFSPSPTSIAKSSMNKIELFLKVFYEVLSKDRVQDVFLENLNPEFKKQFKGISTGGLFLGFDFHETENGPQLIEINTNAGGLIINSILYKVQDECCDMPYGENTLSNKTNWKEHILSYIRNEWNVNYPNKELKTLVILDENPESQFLYPEFKIFQSILLEHNIQCFILSPDKLSLKNNFVYFEDQQIDFIYNRHTDFLLESPSMSPIASAWQNGNLCVSPNPIDFSLYANKSNLHILSNRETLLKLGVEEETIQILLNTIPESRIVKEKERDSIWTERKHLYFKPLQSYGSKGVYAGRKITKSKFDEILALDYLMQKEIPPSTRKINSSEFKIDYRVYVYNQKILMLASRLYQGQTTNFRTVGGGFSPVMKIG
jgi:hypothetical protein